MSDERLIPAYRKHLHVAVIGCSILAAIAFLFVAYVLFNTIETAHPHTSSTTRDTLAPK